MVMPSAIERASAGTARPTAASTMPKPVPPSARPIRRPALRCSSKALAVVAIRYRRQGVEQAARRHRARHAEAVRDHADERLRGAPDQVLDRQGQREHLAARAEVHAHRLQEQAEAAADAERQQDDERAGADRRQRRFRGGLAQGIRPAGWQVILGRAPRAVNHVDRKAAVRDMPRHGAIGPPKNAVWPRAIVFRLYCYLAPRKAPADRERQGERGCLIRSRSF